MRHAKIFLPSLNNKCYSFIQDFILILFVMNKFLVSELEGVVVSAVKESLSTLLLKLIGEHSRTLRSSTIQASRKCPAMWPTSSEEPALTRFILCVLRSIAIFIRCVY